MFRLVAVALTAVLMACSGAPSTTPTVPPAAVATSAAPATSAPATSAATVAPSSSLATTPTATATSTATSTPTATPTGSPTPTATPALNPTAAPTATAAPTSVPTPTPPQPVAARPQLRVLGTENFYADLLFQIGSVRVIPSSVLSDPNVDPHEFEASPSLGALVADQDIVILNGVGYDDWMDKLLGASTKPNRIVIKVQAVLGVSDDVNGHVWYDPRTMPLLAEAATAALTKLDPQNADFFNLRKQAYLASLGAIDAKIATLRAKYNGTPVAFTENVAGYQAAAIGLKVLTPDAFMKAIEDGIDPAPADVAAERDLITQKKIKVLIYNSQVTSPITESIRDLANQNGIPVVGVSETLPPDYGSYQQWMLGQLAKLQAALGG